MLGATASLIRLKRKSVLGNGHFMPPCLHLRLGAVASVPPTALRGGSLLRHLILAAILSLLLGPDPGLLRRHACHFHRGPPNPRPRPPLHRPWSRPAGLPYRPSPTRRFPRRSEPRSPISRPSLRPRLSACFRHRCPLCRSSCRRPLSLPCPSFRHRRPRPGCCQPSRRR